MTNPAVPDISAHPLNNMDTESIEAAAAAVEALGTTVSDNGSQAATAWTPMAEAYKGPGDAQLLGLMTPVGTMSISVGERTASVAKSLRAFKETADEIKASMTTLKADLVTHARNVDAFEPTQRVSHGRVPTSYGAQDWWDDSSLNSENERIAKGLNDAVERMHEAERTCANAIRALHCLVPLTAGGGSYEEGNYGVDTIPHEAETPWGTATPDDENCAEATGNWILDVGKDLVALGGMRWDEDGNFSWNLENAQETWAGLATLVSRNPETGEWGDFEVMGDSWLGAAKDFVAYDRWGKNPEGAGTDVVLNVGTSFIAGAGIITKILKLGRRGRVDGDADTGFDSTMPDVDVPDLKGMPNMPDLDLEFRGPDADLADRPDGPDTDTRVPDSADGNDVPVRTPESSEGADTPRADADTSDTPANTPDGSGDGAPTSPDGSDGNGSDGNGSDGNGSGGSPEAVDPRAATRTPAEDVDLVSSPEYAKAVEARVDAVAERQAAVAAQKTALAHLDELGIHVDKSDLVKDKFDGTIRDLRTSVADDLDLTPDEYDARMSALDDLRNATETERSSLTNQVSKSEQMGDAAARDVIHSLDADIVVDGKGASSGQFDQVGLTRDGDTLVVAEAKGGSANLSTSGRALPDGTRASQGSTLYFNEIFRLDPTLQSFLASRPDVVRGLVDGSIDIRYMVVRADKNGGVHVEDLALDPAALRLMLPDLVGSG